MTKSPDGSLRPNWMHVLLALAEHDRHGSSIARDVLDQTGGSLRLWPATLYRTLDDMVAAGLITELRGNDRPEGESGKRRYYRATAKGKTALAAAAERMSALAGTAKKRLRAAGS